MATKKSKKSKKESTLYYFYSPGCTFCSKIEPVIDELIKDGYDILKLDTSEEDISGLKKEIAEKYKFHCGTPLMIDVETGNRVCGYRDNETIKRWADGKEIKEPPRPKSPPPPPHNMKDKKAIKTWKKDFTKWRKENSHLPNVPTPDDMIKRLEQQYEIDKQRKNDPNTGLLTRITAIEQKLDKLMSHLGVK